MKHEERRRFGALFLVVGLIVIVYVASYLILTIGGAYTPSAYGLRVDKDGRTIPAPKWYSWEPKGFAQKDASWGRIIPYLHLPLYLIDRNWWHTDDRRFRGDYPVRLHPADVR